MPLFGEGGKKEVVRIIFAMRPDVLERFDIYCSDNGMTRTGMVRRMIHDRVKEMGMVVTDG